MKYAITIRYNPAGKDAVRAHYDEVIRDLNITNVMFEATAGTHLHGVIEWVGRYPRRKNFHIYMKPIKTVYDAHAWEAYTQKENTKYPKLDIRTRSSGDLTPANWSELYELDDPRATH